jgi:hypothetical protein
MFFLSFPPRKPARSASCGTELHVVQGDVQTWKNKDRAGGRAGDCLCFCSHSQASYGLHNHRFSLQLPSPAIRLPSRAGLAGGKSRKPIQEHRDEQADERKPRVDQKTHLMLWGLPAGATIRCLETTPLHYLPSNMCSVHQCGRYLTYVHYKRHPVAILRIAP